MLSWESVVDTTDTDSNAAPAPVNRAPAPAAMSASPAPAPVSAPVVRSDVAAVSTGSSPVQDDIELVIAPLSLDPLSLDPLPPIGDGAARRPAPAERADVLGDVHLEMPPLDLSPSTPSAPSTPHAARPVAAPIPDASDLASLEMPPLRLDDTPSATPSSTGPDTQPVTPAGLAAVADVASADVFELTIAPLDLPAVTPSGQVPAVRAAAATSTAPAAASAPPSAPAAASASAASPERARPGSGSAPEPEAQRAERVRPPAAVAGLPDDAVPSDATPTTVIPGVLAGQIAPPSVAGLDAGARPVTDVSVVSVPNHQPNQAVKPQIAPAAARQKQVEPAPVSRKDRKRDAKLKQHNQKQALKSAKASKGRSGTGGIALFFTLLVLVGLIVGAIIFGRPYLFPDAWDDTARPYGEAIEAARGADIADPLVVQRRAADAFATSMTEHVVGPWEDELPTWRSLGLVSGAVDAPLLGKLIENWTGAYYAPDTGDVIANDAVPAPMLDAAIAEAMAAAAIDQERGWSSTIDDTLLDSPALIRASVTASSRTAAAATSFGAADVSARDIGVATFLPPVLEYRVNAPLTFAELNTDDPADFDSLRVASTLQTSTEPELASGDTIVTSQQLTDRTFWYLVFASYTDTRTAYGASNALVQASLATADSAGVQCTYATFSGTDVAGTESVADVLTQWADNAPGEMNATFSTLGNGTMQLRSCDPGVGFESGARFGIGREIARLRAVELAAVIAIPVVDGATADRAAAIADVRNSEVGFALLDLAFDSPFAEVAGQARSVVAGQATPGG